MVRGTLQKIIRLTSLKATEKQQTNKLKLKRNHFIGYVS
jgi:hypothetical protein